ncbi:uncharacterized protein [Ptychodera flava]|uniref:uncharacterized protein n=1 Tax=Ptychodera flava TaxID=63121 RepID=UPI00396A0D3B
MNFDSLLSHTTDWLYEMFRRGVLRHYERNTRILTQGPIDLNSEDTALICCTLERSTTTENKLVFGEQGKYFALNDGKIIQLNIVGVNPVNEFHFGPLANTLENNGLVAQVNVYRQMLVKDDKFYICATDATRFLFGNEKSTIKNNGTIVKIDVYGAEVTQLTDTSDELDLVLVRNSLESPVVKIKCWNRRQGQKLKINGGEIELPVSKTEKLTGLVTDASYILNMTILVFPEKKVQERRV